MSVKECLLARDLLLSRIIVPSRERGGSLDVMTYSRSKGINYPCFIVKNKYY